MLAALWMAECRPQGFEVLELRLAGVQARLEAAAARTEDWCAGSVQRLEELEEGRLLLLRTPGHQPPARRVFLARDRKRIQMLLRTGAPAPRPAKEPERGKGKGMVMQ